AGGRTASIGFFVSTGTTCCTGRALSDVRPEVSGLSGPPRLICITVSGGSLRAPNHHVGPSTNAAKSSTWPMTDAPSIELRPSPFGARPMRTSLTASMVKPSGQRAIGPTRTSQPSLRAPLHGDHADLLNAGLLQTTEYVHHFLHFDLAVGAQVDLFV